MDRLNSFDSMIWMSRCTANPHLGKRVLDVTPRKVTRADELSNLVSKCIKAGWKDAHRLIASGECNRDEALMIGHCLGYYNRHLTANVEKVFVDEMLYFKINKVKEVETPIDLMMYGNTYTDRGKQAKMALLVLWNFGPHEIDVVSKNRAIKYYEPVFLGALSVFDHVSEKIRLKDTGTWSFKICVYNAVIGTYSDSIITMREIMSARARLKARIRHIRTDPQMTRSPFCTKCEGRSLCDLYSNFINAELTKQDGKMVQHHLGRLVLPPTKSLLIDSRLNVLRHSKEIKDFVDDVERQELAEQARGGGFEEFKVIRKKDGKLALVPKFHRLPGIYKRK